MCKKYRGRGPGAIGVIASHAMELVPSAVQQYSIRLDRIEYGIYSSCSWSPLVDDAESYGFCGPSDREIALLDSTVMCAM
jgi:hypothetical protein